MADLSVGDLQGRRRPEDLVLRRDDLEDPGAGERRQGLHARRRQAAGRARAGRADPAHGRHRRERRDRRRLGLRGQATKRLIASSDGNGFIVGEDELLSSTRKGRAVLNVTAPATAALIVPAAGDHVAVIGQNRKLLVFPLAQLNEMARGKGTRLQRYKDGGLSDAKVFALADGLTWRDSAGRTFTVVRPRAQGLDRQSRRSRPPAAEGLPEEQPIWRRLAQNQLKRAVNGLIDPLVHSTVKVVGFPNAIMC